MTPGSQQRIAVEAPRHGGVSLRFIRGYDITNNRRICRFDILAGFAALRPEWAVRVTN